MLIASITVLGAAVAIGLWLGSQHFLLERPPQRLPLAGLAHGAIGLAGIALLLAAPRASAHAARYRAGGFGTLAAAILIAAFAGGLTMLALRLRRRDLPLGIVGLHVMFGASGYVLLCTYLTMQP